MRLRIGDFLRKLISTDVDPEPEDEKQLPIALCSPYSYPEQWKAELDKPCYCGQSAIWLDFYDHSGEVAAVGTCQHHRGVTRWQHENDGPVHAYWDRCDICPRRDNCQGHILVGDKLHTIIR